MAGENRGGVTTIDELPKTIINVLSITQNKEQKTIQTTLVHQWLICHLGCRGYGNLEILILRFK